MPRDWRVDIPEDALALPGDTAEQLRASFREWVGYALVDFGERIVRAGLTRRGVRPDAREGETALSLWVPYRGTSLSDFFRRPAIREDILDVLASLDPDAPHLEPEERVEVSLERSRYVGRLRSAVDAADIGKFVLPGDFLRMVLGREVAVDAVAAVLTQGSALFDVPRWGAAAFPGPAREEALVHFLGNSVLLAAGHRDLTAEVCPLDEPEVTEMRWALGLPHLGVRISVVGHPEWVRSSALVGLLEELSGEGAVELREDGVWVAWIP